MPVSSDSSGTAMELKAKTILFLLGCYFTFSWKHHLIKSCIFLQEQTSHIITRPRQVVLVSLLHMFACLPCYWCCRKWRKPMGFPQMAQPSLQLHEHLKRQGTSTQTDRQTEGCPCCLSVCILLCASLLSSFSGQCRLKIHSRYFFIRPCISHTNQ